MTDETAAPAIAPATDAVAPAASAVAAPTAPAVAAPVVVESEARVSFRALLEDYIQTLPANFTARLESLIDKYHPKA